MGPSLGSRRGSCCGDIREEVPWVIRPADDDLWKHLGSCYIERIMYSEAIEYPEYETEDITLC